MIKDQKILKQKAAEAEKVKKELSEMKSQLAQREEQIAGMKEDSVAKDKQHQKDQADTVAENTRLAKMNKWLIIAFVVLAIAFVLSLVI